VIKSADQRRMVDAIERGGLIKCNEYCRPMISETSKNIIGQLAEPFLSNGASCMQIEKKR